MSEPAPLTDLEIARRAALQPIARIARAAGIPEEAVDFYGRYKAKIDPARLGPDQSEPRGKVVL
ncbi:formate--tetrahydrofolate ligase, partial [Arthrobacter deserti]|nr:formate--tetrahydrofolate ligase [Arthrobacter deserti]